MPDEYVCFDASGHSILFERFKAHRRVSVTLPNPMPQYPHHLRCDRKSARQ